MVTIKLSEETVKFSMGKGMEKKEIELLHNAGISKGIDHEFVYRYPDSKDLPVMAVDGFQTDLKEDKRQGIELAFYVHVPFCTSICGYCHYFKQLVPEKAKVESYLAAVRKEAASYRGLISSRVEANSLLFGGGTPTVLEAEQLNELAGFLRAAFGIEKGIEASIESSPETLSLEKLSLLRQDFNRLSLGVQDFDNGVLKRCNRNHSRQQAVKAIGDARNAGFENVNIDLIYGIPRQGIGGWRKTLEEVEEIQPESVTASDLRVQKGTSFFGMDRVEFASEAELVEMHEMFLEKMSGLGYELSFPYQFVKKGREMRFLLNQWHNKEFLGLGASSCSYLNRWDWNNLFPVEAYEAAVEENGIACAVGKKLSSGEKMVRHARLGLKDCKRGIDKGEFKRVFGKGFDECFGGAAQGLEGLGLVEDSEARVRLSEKGVLFYDAVSRKFV
jgi:oxygen-independent coproporphyrinogen-3 oxidase